jgi:hypothetical protein
MKCKGIINRSDCVSSIVLIVFSVAVCYQASQYPFGEIRRIGPGFVPFYSGMILGLLSLCIFLRSLLHRIQESPIPLEKLTRTKLVRVFSVLFLMLAYPFLISRLGFFLTTFLFCLIVFKYVESFKWTASLFGALGTSIFMYLVFSFWLQCQFPKGWLGI